MDPRPTRRQFMQGTGVAGAALVVGCTQLPWQAQGPLKPPRVGLLTSDPPEASPRADVVVQALRELGYVPGQNIRLDYRYTSADPEKVAQFAHELVQVPVDVIIVLAGGDTIRATRAATSSIPIIMAPTGTDPVTDGLIESYGRPGGNVTGLASMSIQLTGKRLELLKAVLPAVSRVAVLWNRDSPAKAIEFAETEAAARQLGVELQDLGLRGSEELDRAFSAAIQQGAEALLVLNERFTLLNRAQIVDRATASRLPSMYERSEYVALGGLMAYGADQAALLRRAADYADKILKGAKPADLPVEQPTRFDLTINLQTVQALGLTIPQHVLLQVTEVI
jgi:putative ABC transport system substrate-binding protein